MAVLYAQHTADTDQPFTEETRARAFEFTCGHSWLVNALAREIVDKMRIAPPEPITVQHVEQAKARLILARATHLDSLVARLHEDRVRRVIEPLLAGGTVSSMHYDDDAAYVRDLGLIALEPEVHLVNPMYREVIVRVMAAHIEGDIRVPPKHFVGPRGPARSASHPARLRGLLARARRGAHLGWRGGRGRGRRGGQIQDGAECLPWHGAA